MRNDELIQSLASKLLLSASYCSSLTKLTSHFSSFAFLSLFHFLAGSATTLKLFCFLGVNVRSLCVAGFAGGGITGHLLMGGGVFSKKKNQIQ